MKMQTIKTWIPLKILYFIKIHVRQEAGWGYSYFHLFMCECIYLFICVAPPGQTKNDTDLKLGRHTPIDLIWIQVFYFFVKLPWGRRASKNCRVTWIFCISPLLPCFLLLHYVSNINVESMRVGNTSNQEYKANKLTRQTTNKVNKAF